MHVQDGGGCHRESEGWQEFQGVAGARLAWGHGAGGLCPRHSRVNDFQGILEPLPLQSPLLRLYPAG